MSDNIMTSLMCLPNASPLPGVIARCWRSGIASIAMTNRRLRDIAREVITIDRKRLDILEHWFFVFEKRDLWLAFDPYYKVWHNVPLMPKPQYFFDHYPFESNGKLPREVMCVGSELLVCAEYPLVDNMYKFQALTGKWSLVAGMTSQPSFAHAWAVHEENIFSAGGCDWELRPLNSANIYSSVTGLWSPIPPMTHGRMCCKGAFTGGVFYVIGGKLSRRDNRPMRSAEVYDPKTKNWTLIENFLTEELASGSYAITVVNQEIYHSSPSGGTGSIHKYNPRKCEWLFMGSFPSDWISNQPTGGYHMAAYRPVRGEPFEHLVLIDWRVDENDLTKISVHIYASAPKPMLKWECLTSNYRRFSALGERLVGVMGY